MINFFKNLQISPASFWLGFFSGILFAWILSKLSVLVPKLVASLRQLFTLIKENLSMSAEVKFRNDIFRYTQKQHLAANLFSLDEIVIEPKVLTPLIPSASSIESTPSDCVSLAVPYIPDWPELAAAFNGSTMGLLDALQGGANVILAGHPGCGKSVALAWLSAFLSRNSDGLGKLSGWLPLYVHATDIPHLLDQSREINKASPRSESVSKEPSQANTTSVDLNANEVLDLFVAAISNYVSPGTINQLPKIIRTSLENHRAILLLDRVDELPPHQAFLITAYLTKLLEKYPALRVIIAMSYDNLAGLPSLGFSLLGMAAWSEQDQSNLLSKWDQQWVKWIAPIEKSVSKGINAKYLKSWLGTNNRLLKPAEYTLKIWAGYCGDIIGPDGPSAIEAYIRRMNNDLSNNRYALEGLALQQIFEMSITANPNDSHQLISQYKAEMNARPVTEESSSGVLRISDPQKILQNKSIPDIDSLVNNGFLTSYAGSKVGFSHSLVSGFLAGRLLSEIGVLTEFKHQPSWMGKNLAFYYLARTGDVTPLVHWFLQEDDELHTNHLLISRWLQAAPKNRPWRTIILRTLTTALQKERETSSLAAKLMAAMAFSGDAGVAMYFRQLLKSGQTELKNLAALGSGILADTNAIEELSHLLNEQSPASVRSASLALAAIGDKKSLELLASNLLNGDDLSRRYAAESLANNPKEGYPSLLEGSSMQDLQVRRSVIFGLIRINQPWARKIVENLQLEDNEWVVRNAAIEAFGELTMKNSLSPTSPPELTEIHWLADYAVKNGTSVAPGKPGEELIKKAITSGSQDEKLSALDYYRTNCKADSIELVYSTYKTSHGDLRNSAYYILWLMTLAGFHLPVTFEQ